MGGSEHIENYGSLSTKKISDDDYTREKFRSLLREGKLEEREVEVVFDRRQSMPSMEIIAGGNIDDLQNSMQNLASILTGNSRKKRTVTISEARKIITEETLDGMIDTDKVC
ncbi:MAG: hypothetical protein K2M99_05010, partial [Treponemataceae bacterium]|nr:hypothetical protein [Treponemataceae bacterium]